MPQQIIQVDSFTDTPFRGNPAGVCITDGPRDEEWMQAVAAEMNLSETAFLYPTDGVYNLRWFTPLTEVSLCGHATLASAHVLWTEGHVERARPIRFHTKSGILFVTRHGDLITMDFPGKPIVKADPPEGMLEALGVDAHFVGRNEFDYLVEVPDESIVTRCAPDFSAIARIPGIRGVMITARAREQYDFISRFFAPAVGVNEDPVTGSAHCALAPFWAERLGKVAMIGYQASRRGGVVRVMVEGDRVLLSGEAVTVFRGELLWSRATRLRKILPPGVFLSEPFGP